MGYHYLLVTYMLLGYIGHLEDMFHYWYWVTEFLDNSLDDLLLNKGQFKQVKHMLLFFIAISFSTFQTGHVSSQINSLTPKSDQDIISLYNIHTISTRQVMRIKKNTSLGIIG